jgi:glycosyltransferase involved in cell wall biosynthesis
MPSRFEGLPLLAVEALCAQIPVLATNAPGLNEALPPWYPGGCAPGDPGAFAELIASFVRERTPWIDAVAPARIWANERFSLGRMVDAYTDVYETAVRSRSVVSRSSS